MTSILVAICYQWFGNVLFGNILSVIFNGALTYAVRSVGKVMNEWSMGHFGMFLREEDGSTWRTTGPRINVSTIYPIWNGLGLYSVLYGERKATNRLTMTLRSVQIKRVFKTSCKFFNTWCVHGTVPFIDECGNGTFFHSANMTRENSKSFSLIDAAMVKVKIKQSHYRPEQAQMVPASQGSQISWQRHRMMVGCQPYTLAAFTPQEILLVLIYVRG